jgi:hypothetical protein
MLVDRLIHPRLKVQFNRDLLSLFSFITTECHTRSFPDLHHPQIDLHTRPRRLSTRSVCGPPALFLRQILFIFLSSSFVLLNNPSLPETHLFGYRFLCFFIK